MMDTFRAQSLLSQRHLPQALAAFDQAEAAGADANTCAGGRWCAYMLAGNFLAAWLESDEIRSRNLPDVHRFWQGEDLHGKRVILRCLHGYGDAVQLLRYVPRLQTLASELILEVPPGMVEVAPYFAGVGQVITWGAGAPRLPIAWDLQVEIMELPYLFRTSMVELPGTTHYLRLPAEVQQQAAHVMGPGSIPRIGVVWAGGNWNCERSLPLSLLQGLLESSGHEFWCLQGGSERNEWRALPSSAHLRNAEICGDGILALAAAICQLDLVITVDTLAAHLAGALGKPVWILLPYAADWRWMTTRPDSPWYPSARLFRQSSPGDWKSVIGPIQRHLREWKVPATSA